MKVVASVLAALIVMLFPAVPAASQTESLADPRGDADRSALDWTRLKVNNTSQAVTARIDFVNLPAKGLHKQGDWYRFLAEVTLESYDVADPWDYFVSVSRRARAKTTLSIFASGDNGAHKVRCAEASTRWLAGEKSRIIIRVPRSCLPELSRGIAATALSAYPADYEGSEGADLSRRSVLLPID